MIASIREDESTGSLASAFAAATMSTSSSLQNVIGGILIGLISNYGRGVYVNGFKNSLPPGDTRFEPVTPPYENGTRYWARTNDLHRVEVMLYQLS